MPEIPDPIAVSAAGGQIAAAIAAAAVADPASADIAALTAALGVVGGTVTPEAVVAALAAADPGAVPLAAVDGAAPAPVQDTAARFTSGAAFPAGQATLLPGQLGYESDTGRFKIGLGAALWAALPYAGPDLTALTGRVGAAETAVTATAGVAADAVSTATDAEAKATAAGAAVLGITADQVAFTAATGAELLGGAGGPFRFVTSEALAEANALVEIDPVSGDFGLDATIGVSQIAPLAGNARLVGLTAGAYSEVTLRLYAAAARTLSFGAGITVPDDLPQEGAPGEIGLTAGQFLKMTVSKFTFGAGVNTVVSDLTIAGSSPASAPLFGSASVSPAAGGDGQVFAAVHSLTAGNPAPAMSYAWTYLGEAIPGETAYQLASVLGNSGPYGCTITATNSEGAASVTVSAAIGAPVPTLVGTPTVAFNATGAATTTSVALPAGTQAGDWLSLDGAQQNSADTALPTDFLPLDTEIIRMSTTVGEAFRMSRAGRYATADDVAAGAILGVTIRSYSTVVLSAWRGVDLVEYDSADFTQSASMTTTNTLAPPAVTRTRPCVLLALVAGGLGESWDGTGDAGVAASGWTKIGGVTIPGAGQQGRYGAALMMRLWKHGVASPTPLFTVGDASAKTFRIALMTLSGPI